MPNLKSFAMTKKEIIFGRKPILEALQDGIDFDKIMYNVEIYWS